MYSDRDLEIRQKNNKLIGVVWKGNSSHKHPWAKNRSIEVSQLDILFELPNIEWVSLQIDDQVEAIRDLEDKKHIHDFGYKISDFFDTAKIIVELDMVICVDTAVAHLAGALGKPVWLLLASVADWRWLRERKDSPWYPTMEIFRQKRMGDWAGVLNEVADRLREIR